MNSCKISAQNIVQGPLYFVEPLCFPSFASRAKLVSDLTTVSELRAVSALLDAYACVLRLTAETCAIVKINLTINLY